LNNIGFLVSRSTTETDSFRVIASFNTHKELRGHSTKSSTTNYEFIDKATHQPLETYYYKLWGMDAGGEIHELSPVVSVYIPVVEVHSYELVQNYPNPFNATAIISYKMKEAGIAQITIFDLNGRVVFNQSRYADAGNHSLTFNADNLASGTYFYRLKIRVHFQNIKKMMLIK
jgi:hypothetical protein